MISFLLWNGDLKFVSPKSVFRFLSRKRCSVIRCSKTVLPFLRQNGVPKIGVAKLVLRLLSKNGVTKSVWPFLPWNGGPANRCYRIWWSQIGLTKSVLLFLSWNAIRISCSLIRCYEIRCSVSSTKTVSRNLVIWIGVTVSSPKRCSPKSVSRNRCSRFLFLKRCSEIRCSRIWWSLDVDENTSLKLIFF